MAKTAIRELLAFALLYSLIFIVAQALIPSTAEARGIIAGLLPFFFAGMLVCARRTSLWQLCALAISRATLSSIARNSLPYAIVLLVPCANLLLAGSASPHAGIPLLVILACAALIEELFFRGYLMGILLERGVGPLAAAAASAALFACLHLFNAIDTGIAFASAQFVVAGALGLAFGFMRLSTESIYPCMLVHLLVNLTSNRAMLYNGMSIWLTIALAVIVGAWSFLWWRSHARSKL